MRQIVFTQFLLVLVLLVLAGVSAPKIGAQAEDSTAWRVVVQDEVGVWFVTATEIAPAFPDGAVDSSQIIGMVVNGDWYAVHVGDTNQIVVGNWGTAGGGETILPFPDAVYADLEDTTKEVLLMELAAISADGSVLLIRDVTQDHAAEQFRATTNLWYFAIEGDTLTFKGRGEIAAGNVAVEMGPWIGDELHFRVNCFYCTHGPLIQEHGTWRIFQGSGGVWDIWSIFYETGDLLYATRELLTMTINGDYPLNTAEGPVPQPNVLVYADFGGAETTSVVLFNDAEALRRIPARWVLDGAAYLFLLDGAGWQLGWRDGRLEPVVADTGLIYLAATPDGWLMRSSDGRVFHYTSATAAVVLGQLSGRVTVIDGPVLGLGAEWAVPQPLTW